MPRSPCRAVLVKMGCPRRDFFGPSFSDDALAPFADAMHRAARSGMGKDKAAVLPEASKVAEPDDGLLTLMVVGAHLTACR